MGPGNFKGMPLREPLHLLLILIWIDATGCPQERAARAEECQGVCCNLSLHVNEFLAGRSTLPVPSLDTPGKDP